MDGSFGSPSRFPGHGNSFHRHGENCGHHLDLGFSSVTPTSLAPARDSAAACESHDDLCVDRCMSVGLYNGFHQFNHRGRPPSLQTRWSRDNPASRFEYPTDLGPLSVQFRAQDLAHLASDPYEQWFGQPLEPGVPCNDDDCHSMGGVSCCDSQCTMTGKCTDVTCADTEDACTDQNCPERPATSAPSSEVVNGAAALISINHAPEEGHHGFHLQQPVMDDGLGFALSGMPQQSYLLPSGLLPGSVVDITNHLLVAHADAGSTSCTGPCPLDDPLNYPYCHIPLYPAAHMTFNQFDSVGPEFQMTRGLVECGAEIRDPESFLAHFNSQHRPHFISGAPDALRASSLAKQDGTILASCVVTSPPATPLHTSDSGASWETPSPLTPLSNSVDMSDAKPETSPRVRSASVASSASNPVELGSDEEHRCLWRDQGSSDVCGQIFADAEELFKHASETHIKHVQKGAQGFRCGWDDCPRSEAGAAGFPQRSKIERHMQTHIGHKPHICPTCNKGFSAKQALTQHMFIHSNEKPLVCNICHKAFRYPSALTMHQRVHSGLKPLKCPVCGKGFSESSNLSKHKRTHEVKGRFTCTVPSCERNFHRQDQLRRHMKTHQREASSRPPGISTSSLEGI